MPSVSLPLHNESGKKKSTQGILAASWGSDLCQSMPRENSPENAAQLRDCPGLVELYSPAPGSGAQKACREGARAFSHWYFQGSVWPVARGQVHKGVALSGLAFGPLWQVRERWASLKHALVWCEVAVPAPLWPCTDPVVVILKPRPAEQVRGSASCHQQQLQCGSVGEEEVKCTLGGTLRFSCFFFPALKSVLLTPDRQREVLIAHLALCALPHFWSSTELGTLCPKTHGSSAACLWTSERCWAVPSYFSRGQAMPGQITANALQDPQTLPLRSF